MLNFSLLFLFVFYSLSTCEDCIDGETNAITVGDASPGNIIQFNNFVGYAYNANWEPTCNKKQPQVDFPGYVLFVSGTVNITEKIDAYADNTLLMTYKGEYTDYVCIDGEPQGKFVNKSDCTGKICYNDNSTLCDLLGTPGFYTIGSRQLPNITMHINPRHDGYLKSLPLGRWHLEAKLAVKNQTIAHATILSNNGFVWAYFGG